MGATARRPRNATQIAADRAKITSLYLRGWSQYAIAAELGTSRENITYDLIAVRKEWRKQALFDMNEIRQRELSRIDEIEREAWMAWERSKNPRDITSTRQRRRGLQMNGTNAQSVPVDQISEANKRTEERDPNAAFLDKVAWCVETRCKILGLFAPTEMRHSGQIATITEVFYEPSAEASDARLVILGAQARVAPPPLPTPEEMEDLMPEDLAEDESDPA